jgi:predicted nucleic acid-binding protein
MYLDSAIVVKLLIHEPESKWFEQQLSGHNLEISELALAEVGAALLFKERAGDITTVERIAAADKFLSMIENESVQTLALNRQVVERARTIQIACHPQIPVRTLDAVQVATCDLNQSGTMAATDRRIRAACKQLGIQLMPRELEDIAVAK